MADEIKETGKEANDAIESNASATPAQNPVEEARIIEEVVIKPAATPATPPPTPAPAPVKTVVPSPAPPQAPTTFVPPLTPTPKTSLQSIVEKLPPSAHTAPPSSPVVQTPPPIPVPQKPQPLPTPAPVQTPTSSLAPILPISAPRPVPLQEAEQKEREDIARILKDTKIPERPLTAPPSPESKGKVFDTTLGAAAAALDEKKPEAPIAPAPKQDPAEGLAISPLRTLKRDLQEIVQVKKISLVRAAALEQEKRHGTANSADFGAPARKRRTASFLLAAALLIILGGGALFGVYVVMKGYSAAPSANDASILFAESTLALALQNNSPLELKRLLAQARTTGGGTLGSITRLVPIVVETGTEGAALERPATLEEFFQALGTRTSGDLTRALSGEFFFGIHTVDENAPLFVIPVLSYERAFAGMLSWEQTMNADLAPTFTQVPVQTIGANGLPEKRLFGDVVMRNYDVRALKDDAGEIQLYYSFPTRSLLVISESPFSFTEILSRLRAERKL